MIHWDDLTNLIRREITRFQSRHNKETAGFIDSYNHNDHTAKVKLPTELDANGNPRITGWLPFKVAAGGAGASWVIGPQIGDQCTVSYLEGDSESGTISGFLHSTAALPPVVMPGEAVLRHTATGNILKLNAQGEMMMMHAATGNYLKVDQSGNLVSFISSPAQQHYIGGDPSMGGSFAAIGTAQGPSPFAQARFK